jgi:hypothetical protein
VEFSVAVDRDGVGEIHRFRARPHITWRDVMNIVDTSVSPAALEHVIDTALCIDDGPPTSRQLWRNLLDDDDIYLNPTHAQDVAHHLVSTAATGRPFTEVCAFVATTCGADDIAAYLRGRMILAGLDDRAPVSTVLDVLMTTMVDTPAKELEEWRQRFDRAIYSPTLTAVPDLPAETPKQQTGQRQWPDRATWGLLPNQVAATNRLMNAAP